MKIDGKTNVYGILGTPLGHTLSPAIHNAAFAHLGMNACYAPFPTAPEKLGEAIRGIRALNIKGVNVTVPHKTAVMEFLDEVHGTAADLGAVNTIVNRDGFLHGFNTDVEGYRLSLEHAGVEPEGRNAVVLGAGGAARAVIRALQISGARTIALFNRTHEKAEALAAEFSGRGCPIDAWSFSDPEVDTLFESSMIVINTTSLGLRNDDPIPIDAGFLRRQHVLSDLIYNPWETPFLTAGRGIGALTINGYGMLVFQAREAFTLWTGEKPPLKIMWDAAREES